jgi:RNA recognition motif-containing protein
MKKIYVGNLPFSATESDVRSLFEQHGTVQSVNLINDRETGRPRGFGFVEISDSGLAPALKALSGYEMDGRALKVNEAENKPRNGGGGGYRGNDRGGSRW